MTDKVFVVNLKKLEEKELELATLYEMPIEDLKDLSDFVLTPQQAVENLNNPDMADFNTEEYYCVYRKISNPIDLNELITEVVKHSYFNGETIELGNLISLHINEEGNCVDVYKWASKETMEADDYDFDSDYICTLNIGE